MNQNTPEKASSVSSGSLEAEDREALERAHNTKMDGSANQGAASSSPGGDGPKGPSSPTPQSQVFAGHVASLCNEFFIRKFGPDKALSGGMLDALKMDTAAALDLYLPNVDAKPGIFSALVLIGHYIQCSRDKQTEKQSGSSDKAEQEKQPF